MGPDNYWFGARPQILLDRRGPGVDALIENIRAAISRYPYPHEYRAWPGPNSNTFTAYVAREVPELGLNLPSNAVGKDFLPGSALFVSAMLPCQRSSCPGSVDWGWSADVFRVTRLQHRPPIRF